MALHWQRGVKPVEKSVEAKDNKPFSIRPCLHWPSVEACN